MFAIDTERPEQPTLDEEVGIEINEIFAVGDNPI